MRNSIAFLLIVLALSGCGSRKAQVPPHDPSFQPILDQFIIEGESRGIEFTEGQKRIPISFGDTGHEDHYALCVSVSEEASSAKAATDGFLNKKIKKKSYIYVSPRLIEKDLFFIESVIFHELGHCLLGREHTEEKSLMVRSADKIVQYSSQRELYLDELFNLEASFDEETIDHTCFSKLEGIEEAKEIRKSQYSAFGKSLNYQVFKVKDEEETVKHCTFAITHDKKSE